MRSIRFFICIVTLTCWTTSCQDGLDKSLIIGSWQGTAILEGGKPLPIDPSLISFKFDENNQYQFQSTLNYREAGTYFIDEVYLYTTDTFNQASTEKIVEILLLDNDSLHLKMKDQGNERILKLRKSN
jgi:hypothetical protein